MKAMMMSIKPKWVAKILNGEKTIEVRKKFPKDYQGWVYIYCTKNEEIFYKNENGKRHYFTLKNRRNYHRLSNGVVVARFFCDKVEEYVNGSKLAFENGTYIFGTNADFETILKPSCLTEDELYDYCEDLSFKAIHITKLEIFDEPKELSEFYKVGHYEDINECFTDEKQINGKWCIPLKKAPQSWQYIE